MTDSPENIGALRKQGKFGGKRTAEQIAREQEGLASQKAEWEAYSTKELLEGRCPYSGELMRPVMDWWNRRVLMCPNCDCFGYTLVMSDFNPDEPVDPAVEGTGDLTDGVLDW